MASLHVAVASTIMNLLKGSGAPPQLHMFEYLSKMTTTEEILYKRAMKMSKDIPSFARAINRMLKGMKHDTPKEIADAIKKVAAANNGLNKMEIWGLPFKWSIKIWFTHVKPFHPLNTMLE